MKRIIINKTISVILALLLCISIIPTYTIVFAEQTADQTGNTVVYDGFFAKNDTHAHYGPNITLDPGHYYFTITGTNLNKSKSISVSFNDGEMFAYLKNNISESTQYSGEFTLYKTADKCSVDILANSAVTVTNVKIMVDNSQSCSIGDINIDGSINSVDALMALRYSVGKYQMDEFEYNRADVDGKVMVTATDALYILKYSVGLVSKFNRDNLVKSTIISEEELYDKIVGCMEGQMIGVTWAAPTEFNYLNKLIPEDKVPVWNATTINDGFFQDDIYVEVPFIDAMKDNGVDCSVDYLGEYFGKSTFGLCHANYWARLNLINGISASESGHYLNSHCADDIDFQIESDFLGNIYCGLASDDAARAYEIGHIMNYGDGVYGGVFISTMESMAYTCDNLLDVINAGLNAVPKNTKMRNALEKVMECYYLGYTWQEAWQTITSLIGREHKCNEVADIDFNIDAKLNAAYVLIGLMYGEGDFTESMKIAMQCGQDSDCNCSSAASVLGKLYGSSSIDKKYTSALDYDNLKFAYTDYTFNDLINAQFDLAKENMENKGFVYKDGNWYMLTQQTVETVPWEQWPDDIPTAYLQVSVGKDNNVNINTHYVASGNVTVSLDMGDGTIYDYAAKSHHYAAEGTYTVSFTVTCNEKSHTAKKTVEVINLMPFSVTPIISNTATPIGSGSKDLSVICDNYIPTPSQESLTELQYDTFGATSVGEYLWIGLLFDSTQSISALSFTEGIHFFDGGYYDSYPYLTPDVEVLVDGKWIAVGSYTDPDPIGTFKTHIFYLNQPVLCDGIRYCGTVGGTAGFTSCAEIYAITSDKIFNASTNGTNPKGGGNRSISVISNGVKGTVGLSDPKLQYDTYKSDATGDIWFSIDLGTSTKINGINFTEGVHQQDGGWFVGTPTVEVYIDDEWQIIKTNGGNYPTEDSTAAHPMSTSYTTYCFEFDSEVTCSAVRISGTPGGSATFASCAELSPYITSVAFTPIISHTNPQGGVGSHDPNVICDGVIGSTYSDMYDTFGDSTADSTVYFGVEYSKPALTNGVVFTGGFAFDNGGWYDSTPTIEIKINGKWIAAQSTINRSYSVAIGENFKQFKFILSTPQQIEGIRVVGKPGGSASFVSCAEITPIF